MSFRILLFRNVHRKTSVLDSLFNEFTGLKSCNFIKKRLQYMCFPVNIAKFLRAASLWKNSGGCFWEFITV